MNWAKEKSDLSPESENSLDNIISVNIDAALFSKLHNSFIANRCSHLKDAIDITHFQKYQKIADNPPDWMKDEGFRIYLLFDRDQKAYWSMSEHNLNSFVKKEPDAYLGDAIKVPLTTAQYVAIYAYYDYMGDIY